MKKLFILCLLAPLLAGCPQGSTRDVIDNGLAGAASGFISGGPVGAIVGGILAAVGGGAAISERRTRQRRERVIDHYRRTAGDIEPVTLAKVKEGVTIFPLTRQTEV